MLLADVNVFVEAAYKGGHRHHQAMKLVVALMSSQELFGWNSSVLSAVVRICSNPNVLPAPAPLEESLRFCRAIVEAANSIQVEPSEGFWTSFDSIVFKHNIRGRRTTDAYFAALAISSGCTWVTWDRDFWQFKDLDVISPEDALASLEFQ